MLDALYKVLDNKTVQQHNGKFEQDLLNELWSADTYRSKQAFLFKLLIHKKFKICYQADDQFCYVPAHFTTTPKIVNWQGDVGVLADEKHLKYRCQFDFMPKGILSQLIVVLHKYIVDDNYWRFGVLIEDKKTLALLTEINFNNQSAIQVEIEGLNRAELLYDIKKEIREICSIFPNLKYQNTYGCICEECKQLEEPHYFTEKHIKNRMEKGKTTIECVETGNEVNVYELIGYYDFHAELINQLQSQFDRFELKIDRIESYLINQLPNKAEVENIIQYAVSQNSATLADELIHFISLAFQAKDELDIENFNELMEEFVRAKSSSNWETKLKIGIPILEMLGVQLGLETKFNLKSWLGSLTDRANELVVKYGLV